MSGLFCKEVRSLKENLGTQTGNLSYLSSIGTKFLAIVIQLKKTMNLRTKRIKRTTAVMKRRWMKKLRTKRIKRTTTGKFAVSFSQCC